jgi:hypothetical protein
MVLAGGEFPVFLFYLEAPAQNSSALAVYFSLTEF